MLARFVHREPQTILKGLKHSFPAGLSLEKLEPLYGFWFFNRTILKKWGDVKFPVKQAIDVLFAVDSTR